MVVNCPDKDLSEEEEIAPITDVEFNCSDLVRYYHT